MKQYLDCVIGLLVTEIYKGGMLIGGFILDGHCYTNSFVLQFIIRDTA